MLIKTCNARLAAIMLLGVVLSPARGHAQAVTKVVNFTLNIPITASKLHPAIIHVRPECVISLEGNPLTAQAPLMIVSMGRSQIGQILASELPRSVPRTFALNVPEDAGGKTGSYQCYLVGSLTPLGAETRFGANATDPRFKTAPGTPEAVSGTFVF